MLTVSFGNVCNDDGSVKVADTWRVAVSGVGQHCNILRGFARKRDAEIAVEVLNKLPVDWSVQDVEELRRQLLAAGFGSRKALMRHVCEHLQW